MPSGADPRRPYAVIAILLVVIVVLAIRPWGDDQSRPAVGPVPPGEGQAVDRTALPEGSIGSEPTPAEAGLGVRETCGSPSGWRAATRQEWAGRSTPIRSWIAIEPVTASNPLDPAIPFAPVATWIVTAIGYCAPVAEASRPPAVALASLWAIRNGQATPLSLRPLEPASPDALGGLWGRPPEVDDDPGSSPSATGSDAWPPGRYVIEVATMGGAYRQWLGIEVLDLALLRASPSSAVPSPSAESSSASPVP